MSWIDEAEKETESKYLSAKDLPAGIVKKYIMSNQPEIEEFADGSVKRKLVLKDAKPMILNKTNLKELVFLAREKHIDDLNSRVLSLMKQKVLFNGSYIDAVRIVDLE